MAEEKVEKKEKETRDEQSLENRCPACKASISFNPKLGKWKCDYCGSEFTLEEMQKENDNASTKEKNVKETKNTKDNYDGYISYKCESCGAEIVADDETSATFCVYCGNTAILQSKLSGKFSPDKVIPFKKTKEEAIEAFKNLSKGRPLMPKGFNNTTNIEKIRGVYIPFWLYDVNVSGNIDMTAETVEHWRVGDTHYTRTNFFKVTRGGTIDFDKVPVDGSSHFDNDIMNSIEPFNFNDLIPYNHAYLSGFYAEKYDEEGDKVFSEVANRSLNSARDYLKNDARIYVHEKIVSDTLQAKETNKIYALLPVWMVNVKYNGKMHIFAMNGQTGEFIGNIPLDKRKALLYTIVLFVGILVIGIIISYIIYVTGGAQ